MTDDFSSWGIRREVSAGVEPRVRFVVESEDGPVKILKTRRDVVIFLAKNTHINLEPKNFVFKLESSKDEKSSQQRHPLNQNDQVEES